MARTAAIAQHSVLACMQALRAIKRRRWGQTCTPSEVGCLAPRVGEHRRHVAAVVSVEQLESLVL